MRGAVAEQKNGLRLYGIALAVTVFFTVLVYLCFPFRLDLNDDVLMKDILSGAYTGVPDGHNIQMLYPLGAFLAGLYRMIPALPWYGIFLCGTQTVCLSLILGRAMKCAQTQKGKGWTVFFFLAFAAVLLLPHVVFYQYTVTCALCAGTAAFLLYSGRGRGNDGAALVLLVLAYLVRSEMLLLVLPLCGVALLYRVLCDKESQDGSEEPDRRWLKSNVTFAVILLAGLCICFITNAIAYGKENWKTFVVLFNNRTELYDFHRLPAYEEHEEFYTSIGLSQSEQELLVNYNYGLDESITKDTLGAVADYAAAIESKDVSGTETLSPVSRYLYRLRNFSLPAGYLFPQSDMPWNLLTILCYILWLVQLRSLRNIWKPALLFMCRSALWMYILVRGRDPVRITHGLYLVELLIIIGVIITGIQNHAGEKPDMRKKITNGFIIGLPVLALLLCYGSTVPVVKNEITARIETEERFRPLFDYMDDHPENFYYMDVFTWVPYIEPLFAKNGMRPANRDICGGWACKSPVYEEKLAAFSFSDMQSALLCENVFFVLQTGADTDWLVAYYRDKGMAVRLTETERIGDAFLVYRVSTDN